jgi:hypothetical protein
MPFIFARHQSRLAMTAVAILVWIIAGCGGPARALAGKWRMADSSATVWEFSKNGSVLIGSTQGRYTLDRNRVKIETPFATSLYQMEFSGDHLTLRPPKGSKLEFTRIRESKS